MTDHTRRQFLTTTGAVATGLLIGPTTVAAQDTDTEIINTDGDTPNPEYDEHEWNQLQHHRCYIYYPDGYRDDAEQIREHLTYARATVTEYFTLNPDHEVEVFVYPMETYPEGDAWRVVTHTGVYGGDSPSMHVEIVVPAPSEHTMLDDGHSTEYRDKWYQSIVTHEYTQVPMYRMIVNGPNQMHEFGNTIPDWFVQGVPEYMGVFAAPDPLPRRVEEIQKTLDNLASDKVAYLDMIERYVDPYSAGPNLIKFIKNRWSWSHVKDFYTTEFSSFDEALERVLGVSKQEFEQQWLLYLNTEHDADYTIDEPEETTTTPTPTTNPTTAPTATSTTDPKTTPLPDTSTPTSTTENPFNQTYPPVKNRPQNQYPTEVIAAFTTLAGADLAFGGYLAGRLHAQSKLDNAEVNSAEHIDTVEENTEVDDSQNE